MSDYTPTTKKVRDGFRFSEGYYGDTTGAAQFDRWLAAHDAEVAAKALEDTAEFLSALPADEDADVIMWVAERCVDRAASIRGQ